MSDCDMPSCFQQTERKARVQHICCECGGAIKKSERYQFKSGIWEGGPESFKTCADCEHLRCEMMRGGSYDDCIPLGYLIDQLMSSPHNAPFRAMFNAYSEVRNGKTLKYE